MSSSPVFLTRKVETMSNKDTAPVKSPAGFFSFQQLIFLAGILLLAVSGFVSVYDLLFVIFSFFYFFFFSRVILPPKDSTRDGPLTSSNNKAFRRYVASAGIVGLLIPICYIVQGIIEGDKRGVGAAAPHVFLLASQVFMEGVAAKSGFSAPARILVPVIYNARRIFTIVEWLGNEFSRDSLEYGNVSAWRLQAGKVLAVVNIGVWSFNLFCVLIPVYLPKAFKRYYGSNKD